MLRKTACFFLKIVYASRLMTLCGIALNRLRGVTLPFFVHEIKHEVGADEEEVENIEREHVVELPAEDFSEDPRNIPHDDGEHEHQALPLRRLRRPALIDGYRPRNPKTNQHDAFQNSYHNFYLLKTYLHPYYTLDKR